MKRRTIKGLSLALAGALVIFVGIAVARFDAIMLWALEPGAPFDPSSVPTPPDYAQADAWSARPDRQDPADVSLPDYPAIDPALAPVDVFYLHPSAYVGSGWNGSIDDPKLAEASDRGGALIQASAFNGCCAVHAPRYRQANLLAFTHPSPDGQRAIDLAYTDVAAAFHAYLAEHEPDRPFLIAAHSQGSVLALRLVREEISGTPLRERLVAAYLVGVPLDADALARDLPDVPICEAPDQTGCIVGWNARAPGYEQGKFEMPAASRVVCVNPITWRHDELEAAAADNPGAVFFDSDEPALLPGFASARCEAGTLVVAEIGEVPRDFMSRLLDRALGEGNLHPIEYQLFYASIRANAQARVDAFVAKPR